MKGGKQNMSLLSLGADMNISEKILVVFCAGIGVPFLGFVCGQFFSAWFPFRLTKKFYLPIKSARLQKFLISGETFHWGAHSQRAFPRNTIGSPQKTAEKCVSGGYFFISTGICFSFFAFWYGSADCLTACARFC